MSGFSRATQRRPFRPSTLLPRKLVGREREWAQLQQAWRSASDGQPRVAVLSGEAGLGKTRLAEEMLEWGQRQGIATASAQCYASAGGLAYGPVANWLRSPPLRGILPSLSQVWLSEIARLLPELLVEQPQIPPPGPLTESWQRQRLFQALTQPLFQHHQLLLLLDDVQWCDPETLEWLSSLLHLKLGPERAGRRPTQLLVIVTLRSEEAQAEGGLETLLQELRTDRLLSEIELGPLSEAETFSLATDVAGLELDPALSAMLYRGSEGNPLFVIEMVRAGGTISSQQTLAHDQEKDRLDSTLPPKVQQIIEARLAQLSPEARALVGTAATIGREFTFDVLARAQSADEETSIQALDELWRRHIVREQGMHAYDFAHDRIREVTYGTLSAARQRFLHRRVAEALVAVHAGDLDAVAGQVAAHYERADQAAEAIPYLERAAGAARRSYANQQAVGYLRRAIGLLPAAIIDKVQAARLHEQLGDVLALSGNHEQARQAYQEAVSLAPSSDRLWHARLQCQVADTWRSQHRYAEAGVAYDAAMRQLAPGPTGPDPKWWHAWLDIQLARADMLYFQSRLSELAELCRGMERIVTAHGSIRQQASYYHVLVMLHNRQSRFRPSAEEVGHVARAVELARKTDDQPFIDAVTFSLGFTLLWFGDLEAAKERLQAALRQAERTGNVPLQDRCLAYLSIACRLDGDEGQVRAYVRQGLKAAISEQNSYYIGVAKANLSWLSHRKGNLGHALRVGVLALEQWRALAYPLEWLARWPLLSVHFSQDQVSRAVDEARAMLVPAQQRLADVVEVLLEEAVQAWDQGKQASAGERLRRAINLAGEIGYL